MKHYKVQQGDTLLRIAKQFGLSSSKALYMHPSNAEFRKLRPDPNVIYPGDRINIPDREPSVFSGLPDRRHVFVHSKTGAPEKELLRINLKNGDGQCIQDIHATLRVGDRSMSTISNHEGILTFDLTDIDETEGELEVFLDPNSTEPSNQFTLQFAHLDPIDTMSGIQARCNNLGFDCGVVDGVFGEATRQGIRAFQAAQGLTVDGEPGPKTQNSLVKAYGC